LNAQFVHVHGGPQPGKRAPIRNGDSAPDSGNTPRFALFAEDSSESRSLLSKYPSVIEPSPRRSYTDGGIWLVRPDGYVALAAKQDAWSDLERYLSGLADNTSFSVTSDVRPGTRTFSSFSDPVTEIANARVFGGIARQGPPFPIHSSGCPCP
jgi:hypothetical protein